MKNVDMLKEYLTKLASGGLCVAFSGGVDSTVLLKAACTVSENVHAVTLNTAFHSPLEPKLAEKLALEIGASFKALTLALPAEIMNNPPDRCYLCKKAIFTELWDYAGQNSLRTVLDGTHADDLKEYRPGLKALKELNVRSPFAELGITKSQVREIAREFNLSVAEKPSTPCLATRIPYNTRIEPTILKKISELEEYLKSLGFTVARARIHGDTVRLEVLPETFHALLEARGDIINKTKALGFQRITLDLEGFRSGSFDEGIANGH